MTYSLNSYRALLGAALAAGYGFRPFADAPAGEPCIYLRHDVDYSPKLALELARVNSDLGVRGTFFLLLRSPIYNLLSQEALRRARAIADLGQWLGLHVAVPAAVADDPEALAALIQADFSRVADSLPMVSRVFSIHNPTPTLLVWSAGAGGRVGTLVNAGARRFSEEIPYYSDSNLRHSVGALQHVVEELRPAALQLLLHPLNWVVGGATMVDVLARTWPHVIREREEGFLGNRSYAAAFPGGLPQEIVDAFADRCARAGRADAS